MKKKIRPLGKILLDLEPYYLEMADHDIQWSDFMGLLYVYLMVHLPNHQEEYDDGTVPIFFFGHREEFIKRAERLKNEL